MAIHDFTQVIRRARRRFIFTPVFMGATSCEKKLKFANFPRNFPHVLSCFMRAKSCEKSLETYTFGIFCAFGTKKLRTFCARKVGDKSHAAETSPIHACLASAYTWTFKLTAAHARAEVDKISECDLSSSRIPAIKDSEQP